MKNVKSLLFAFILLYAAVTFGPALIYFHVPSEAGSPAATAAPSAAPTGTPQPFMPVLPDSSPDAADTFTLSDASGESLEVSARQLIRANLACEMDLAAPDEALKAQAVASYSYFCRLRADGREIACDQERWQTYVSESAMRDRWGEDFEAYSAILDRVADAVNGERLEYGGRPALCCCFAISAGSTEDAANVWGGDEPYLRAVASPGDMFSDGYLSYVSFTEDELRGALEAYDFGGSIDLGGEADNWLTEAERTPSGTVKSLRVGGLEASGGQMREALGLRSAAFEWEYGEGGFRFTVRGWGHGVGMSQAGAVFMAKRGASYKEILGHYYPGTEWA